MLKFVMPGLLGYRIEIQDQVTDLDIREAESIWLAREKGSAKLTAIPDQERKDAFSSLYQTLERVEYYRRKFNESVNIAIKRRELVGGNVTLDQFGIYVRWYALPVLIFARSFIDEVIYISARRLGVPVSDAIEWGKNHIERSNTEEWLVLSSNIQWFKELNSYRNALVHRGSFSYGGYYPKDSRLVESKTPKSNFMLIPDLESISGHKRIHQWTYLRELRLDDLVQRVYQGLLKFISELVNLWNIEPVPQKQVPVCEQPNLYVCLFNPACVVDDKCVHLPMFSSYELASEFHRVIFDGHLKIEPFEVPYCTVEDDQGGAGYRIRLPISVLRNQTSISNVRIHIDPIYEAATKQITSARHTTMFDLADHPDPSPLSERVFISKTQASNLDKLFIIREIPNHTI